MLLEGPVDVEARVLLGVVDFHTGTGLPQKRLRVIDQSRAFSSHLPNEPSLMWSGTQRICWLSSISRSLTAVTSTNHDETPL